MPPQFLGAIDCGFSFRLCQSRQDHGAEVDRSWSGAADTDVNSEADDARSYGCKVGQIFYYGFYRFRDFCL